MEATRAIQTRLAAYQETESRLHRAISEDLQSWVSDCPDNSVAILHHAMACKLLQTCTSQSRHTSCYPQRTLNDIANAERCDRNADARIAVHLNHIKDHCPGLKTLHLHILANQELQETFEPLVRNNETASALRQLLPRLNHLVIITFGPDDLLHEFRDGITSENPKTHHWAHEEFLTWPSITMSEWEVAGMKARKDRSGPSTPSWARSPHIERIHGFHLCKAGHLQAVPGTRLWANRNGRTWCDVPNSQLPVWVDYGLIECPRW